MKEEYSNQYRRWYDKDPVLSEAVKTLEETDDQTQIRVALNLIKIIIEHNIEDEKFEAVDDIINAVGSGLDDNRRGRWYDIDTTLRTAMNMLQNCPADTQKVIAKEMAKMVVDKMALGKIKVKFAIAEDITKLGYAETLYMDLDIMKIAELGWRATVNLQEMFERMIRGIGEYND